jgi:large subunit ribosomal protein L13e
MTKHNNAIQKNHFRKHWQRWVKTWFNQAGRKRRRLDTRRSKAEAIAPRPLKNLRPSVRCPTQRYNRRLRLGKGFTLEEIKQAGLNKHFARTVGVSVDHRRTNKSAESLQRNVNRLKEYVERLVVLPRNAGQPKKGNKGVLADAAQSDNLVQNTDRNVMSVETDVKKQPMVNVSKEMNQFRAYDRLQMEKMNKKWAGIRAKRLLDAEAKKN